VLLVIQSVLVSRRKRMHRRVGVLGAVLATSMVLSTLFILYYGILGFYQAGRKPATTSPWMASRHFIPTTPETLDAKETS
jgi:hypothetical protein